MKMTAMSWVYPIVMKGAFKNQLQKRFDKNEIKELIRLTNKEYWAVLKRAPEIGGNKNFFIANYHMGAYLIALYKNTKDTLSIGEFSRIIEDGLNDFSFMKRKMQKKDLLSIEFKEKIIKAGAWCEHNIDIYPAFRIQLFPLHL